MAILTFGLPNLIIPFPSYFEIRPTLTKYSEVSLNLLKLFATATSSVKSSFSSSFVYLY